MRVKCTEPQSNLMFYRRSAQLALQASLLLALEAEGSSRPVREIAAALDAPASYLSKVLHNLTRVGLLRSVRGPRGGVQLARSARDIYLWDILSALEPAGELESCFLGLARCNAFTPCPVHKSWAPIRAQILNLLQTKSLGEFATEARSSGALPWPATNSHGSALRHPLPGGK